MSSRAKRIRLESSRQMRSQVTTIEKLCDDVLVEIFSCLSAEDLKSATVVCKHWNEVIGSSAGSMKKFKLKLKQSELSGRQFRSSRNYQNIELEMLATNLPSDQKSLENLDRHFELSQVKYFKIFAYNQLADPKIEYPPHILYNNPWRIFSIDAMKLTSFLKQLKQLQELFIECPAGFRGSFTSAMDLSKLTKLAVKSPDMSIFQRISASNVTEIDLSRQSICTLSVTVQHLASFLKLCKRITTLKLNSSLLHDLFGNNKWKDFNLKLSDLDIEINRNPDATSLSEFLISQRPSLTSLKMKNHFGNLSGSEGDAFFEALGQLKNLKILSLDHFSRPGETFLKHLTELEQLTHMADDINSIARFNRKLTYLKIGIVRNSLDATLEFSELRHLCIGYYPPSNCLKVIRGCPKVETIELILLLIGDERYDETIGAILQHPTVRHLKIENLGNDWSFGHLEIALDMIITDYRNLKSLSLSKKVGSGWKYLEFSFPQNRSEWKVDEQKTRLWQIFGNNE